MQKEEQEQEALLKAKQEQERMHISFLATTKMQLGDLHSRRDAVAIEAQQCQAEAKQTLQIKSGRSEPGFLFSVLHVDVTASAGTQASTCTVYTQAANTSAYCIYIYLYIHMYIYKCPCMQHFCLLLRSV